MCRADREIPASERKKIALFCNVRPEAVIQALDVASIYDVPLAYHHEGLDQQVLDAFGITGAPRPDLTRWETISRNIAQPEGEVTIAIVGKYTGLKDAYKSLIEALVHGGIANRVKVKLDWIESEVFEREDAAPYLEGVNGILVPGGFGERGAEGKIAAAKFARERGVPYFGICFGMQMACLEAARNLAGVNERQLHRVRRDERTRRRHDDRMDARQRTRAAAPGRRSRRHHAAWSVPRIARRRQRISRVYGSTAISERHRHRYEVNTRYRERLEACGLPLRAHHPMACCPRRSSIPIIRGSSACSITRN